MTNEISKLFEDMKTRMGGYAFLLKYRFIHFSVKSDPAVLLAADIMIDGEAQSIEELAEVMQPNDFQLAIVPDDISYVVPICEAILQMHPEYKIEKEEVEMKPQPKNEALDEIPVEKTDDEPEVVVNPIIIICTMPEMNEDRKDAGMDYVKLNYDGAIAKLDAVKVVGGARLGKLMVRNSTPQLLDTYKKELDKLYNQHKSICDAVRKEKEEEIMEAYQNFMEREKAKQELQIQKEAAEGESVSKGMKIDPFLQD